MTTHDICQGSLCTLFSSTKSYLAWSVLEDPPWNQMGRTCHLVRSKQPHSMMSRSWGWSCFHGSLWPTMKGLSLVTARKFGRIEHQTRFWLQASWKRDNFFYVKTVEQIEHDRTEQKRKRNRKENGNRYEREDKMKMKRAGEEGR